MANPLMQENVWLQKQRFEEAEAHYYAVQAGTASPGRGQAQGGGSSLRNEISQARQQIQNALKQPGGQGGGNPQIQNRLDDLEKENKDLRKVTSDLRALVQKLESRVAALEKGSKGATPQAATPKPAAKPAPPAGDDDDDDFDLFGDDDEEDEKEKAARQQKLVEAYKAKKAKKPAVIAKSSVVLDCKPWDDETDMKEMERLVRSIEKDGLTWGAAKLAELAYGIKKLTIICVVEDDKISIEELTEEIEGFEDLVQSVDVAAFNKI